MTTSDSAASPLVCIHGFSGSWRNWVPVVPLLEQHHPVHVARLAGHARGPQLPTGTPATVSALADQLEGDLDRAGIARAHLVGNSLGGWLSLELAARGRALSVVALSPALGWDPNSKHLRQLEKKLRVGRKLYSLLAPYAESVLAPTRVRQLLLNGAFAHAGRISVVEAAAFMRDNLRCEIYFDLMDSFLQGEPTLGAIDCPVHIVWGGRDSLLPYERYGLRFPELVPHAELTTLEDVGHVPMYDDPELVAKTVVDFTSAIDASLRPVHQRDASRRALTA